MTLPPLPQTIEQAPARDWSAYQPYYEELQNRPVTPETAGAWLADWSHLSRWFYEVYSIIYIEKTLDTADKAKEEAFLHFVEHVFPPFSVAEQKLKERLLALDLQNPDLQLMLRQMKTDAALFREANIPLQTELQKLGNEYDNLTGGLKVTWDGEEKNLAQLTPFLESQDPAVRERAWRAIQEQWHTVRTQLDEIYLKMLALRVQIAKNADEPDFRTYTFKERGRFDYTPADCFTFHKAIEEVIVPAAQKILYHKAQALGVPALKPWDWVSESGIVVDTRPGPALTPYQTEDELIQTSLNIFNKIDVELGRFFADMAENQLLDLQSRPGKAMGGYCSTLPLRRKPYIFMNGVGNHDTVQTLLHEAGHAFHAYAAQQPLIWQENAPMEFCEVASMSMELLAGDYLTKDKGGFYTPAEAARARLSHLEGIVLFLPYMATVDAFQHWVYTHTEELLAGDGAAKLDAKWLELCQRFLPGLDWTGFEAERMSGWHRKLHIYQIPFYYIEYGMAQIGALQVWRNSLINGQAPALTAYRNGLAQGGQQTLPQLFKTAGAEFRFDTALLRQLVDLVENTFAQLEAQL